jgi:hypothetical protein
MLKLDNLGTISTLLFILATSVPTPGAQPMKTATVAPGPVPTQISTAKSVFVSNGGGDCNPLGSLAFDGDSNRAYDEFYAAMKSWGRYGLAGAPADADLVFQISFTCPSAGSNAVKGASGTIAYDPQLRLLIVDLKTHVQLWTLIEHVRPAVLQGNREKNFEEAMAQLGNDVKHLTAAPAAAAGGAQK